MGRIKLEEKYTNFIRNAIDLTVTNTGYPVLGSHLERTGIATRKQLRTLEKQGHIKSIKVVKHYASADPLDVMFSKTGTVYTAYYTERNIPQYVLQQQN